ncbi:bacterial Ig-like domain-containing protein [Prevotella copri]|uniref:Bacterial Ig-like domain-containing protein n=1 Tax=Segatella copri TaxID=165179 RepID=A0AAW5IRD7_9BACT|nr:bacterial Ig-like domain-containing protein [Segatella copri]MCP9551573.1 bacterial Ig-like domain-containing protein [Segatella copri]MCP9572173.1 bacterial Ig-like domain-containing protein [Segatella copri]MCP9575260.1 bacterial Ig-like domain-containing protein [Segatella copri]MCP9578206.1 bacterial Ig-like domain-containing protein [Segatella copri]MCP9581268.1 bacterial Ig-like domain-containing protein [Segatella copri]
MKRLNKLAAVFCVAAMALTAMTGCEGSDMFSVNSPDWLSEKIDSIEKANQSTEEVLVGMNEDVYTVGNTDFSSAFWTSFSKYYVVQDNQKWNAVFNLNINPSATNTYKNFALVITNDVDRGGTGYTEYGAIRFDNQPSGNSEWGDHIDRSCVQSNLTFETDKDKGVDKLGGKVTLTVDRSRVDTFMVKITNGTVTKTYIQPSKIANLNADESNTNIRCFLVPEGSFIDFQQSNVEPIGGYTSAQDKAPVSMVLNNVPAEVDENTPLEKAMENVSATVTFEEGITKVIPAKELYFSAINDMDVSGTKNLIVIYNKTFKGENASTPIVAQKTFEVVPAITALHIVSAPTRLTYKYYEAAGITNPASAVFPVDTKGLTVQATYLDGVTRDITLDKLAISAVPMKVGKQAVTVTAKNGVKTTFDVTVEKHAATFVTPSPAILGAEDCTTGWWGAHLDADVKVPAGETRAFSFTNLGGAANWNNYVVVLRNAALAEYVVVRSDNFGWTGDNSGPYGWKNCTAGSTGAADWATWLAGMNGAKVVVYVTNNNNGTADVLAITTGTDGKVNTQYYYGIDGVDANDLFVDFTVDSSCLKFDTAASARKYSARHR